MATCIVRTMLHSTISRRRSLLFLFFPSASVSRSSRNGATGQSYKSRFYPTPNDERERRLLNLVTDEFRGRGGMEAENLPPKRAAVEGHTNVAWQVGEDEFLSCFDSRTFTKPSMSLED